MIVAVFDGHGNDLCAQFGKDNFIRCFRSNIEKYKLSAGEALPVYRALCSTIMCSWGKGAGHLAITVQGVRHSCMPVVKHKDDHPTRLMAVLNS